MSPAYLRFFDAKLGEFKLLFLFTLKKVCFVGNSIVSGLFVVAKLLGYGKICVETIDW